MKLKYYSLGNGLTVARGEIADAHISRSRKVTFYCQLPFEMRAEIYRYAMYANHKASESQDAPVFDTPSLKEQAQRWCQENGYDKGHFEDTWWRILNGVETLTLLGEEEYLKECSHGPKLREVVYLLHYQLTR